MSNTPKIRFSGFTENWEQRKLGELGTVQTCKRIFKEQTSEQGDIPFFKNGTIGLEPDSYISREVYEEFRRLYPYPEVGDTLISVVGSIGRTAEYTGKDEYFQDSNVVWLKTDGSINKKFLKISYQVIKWLIEGSTVKHLYNDNILRSEIVMPVSQIEQAKIAEFFEELDKLITLHQRKYDDTKLLKKYMLQKMFPQNGQKVPEIRFSGFTGDWEQRKLGDWGNFYYGRSCPKWSVTEDATIPCIRYGELYTKFGAKIDRVYSYTNMPPENLRFSKGTEVLIPRVGEDPMDYNHCTWLSMQDVAIGEMISVFNTDNNPLFTATMFNATLQNEFAMRVEGGSVTNLYFEKLKNIDVSFPSIPEQEKIAAYFENFDHLITLHQQKCEELKKIKKFMLQKMFV